MVKINRKYTYRLVLNSGAISYLVSFFTTLGTIEIAWYGDISAWRLVFLVVGLPGVLVALLMWFTVQEPKRDVPAPLTNESHKPSQIGYLKTHKNMYLLLYLGLIAFGFWLYAILAWFPVVLLRTYDVTAQQVALGYGTIFIIAGMGGALSVSYYIDKLLKRGVTDAPVVLSLIAVILMFVPALLFPVMDTFIGCLALFAICMYCWALIITASYTCVAWVTISGMMGLMTAIYMVVMNIFGGSTAAIVVGALSDRVFGPENIRYTLVVVALISMPVSALFFYLLRPLYKARLQEMSNLEASANDLSHLSPASASSG